MIIIIDMPDIPYDSTSGEIIREWIEELTDKSTENKSPLRYAREVKFEKEEQ